MDAAYLSAFAALAGSAVGGLMSVFASQLSQTARLKSELILNDKGRKQELYREFLVEASKAYLEALTLNTPDIAKGVVLYALISRMRVLSSIKVIAEADNVVQLILRSYPEGNKTLSDLSLMMDEHRFDPLRRFSEACRKELEVA